MQVLGRQVKFRIKKGDLKFVIVDPSMNGGVITPLYDKGEWIPIKPATDNAFGMGLIRWIIENEKYNEEFLSFPNFQAGVDNGYNSYSSSTHLVIEDKDHPNYRKMLRTEDLGLEVGEDEEDVFIVIDKTSKEPVKFNEVNNADLYFEGKVKGANGEEIEVVTSFLKIKEAAYEHELEEYSQVCGIPVDKITEIADDFTSHGTKVGITGLGGTAAANGSDMAMIHYTLMAFTGSLNKKGGVLPSGASYSDIGPGPRYNVGDIPNAPERDGMRISRTGISYEDTSEYKNKVDRGENPYPSKMPWHPTGGASDNQTMFSLANGYPYKAKILFNWMANPLLGCPGAAREEVRQALKDTANVPLVISCDCYMGEMTALADYVVPDTTSYESWGIAGIVGCYSGKGNTVRWPVVEPATQKLEDGRHLSFETYVIDIAKKMGLPGFGDEGMLDIDDKLIALNSREDYFLRGIANLAYDEDAVADISKEEIEMQDLETAINDWKDILTDEEWPKVLNVLAKGGRFEEFGEGFDGENHLYPNESALTIYSEGYASKKNSFTGEYNKGVPGLNPERFSDGTPISEVFPVEEWPFKASSHKPKFRSISMLSNSSSLRDLSKHNHIEMNSEDAEGLGIKTMDKIRVMPATGGDFEGYALVRPGIAKGSISIAFGYGHWEYGSKDYNIDGKEEKAMYKNNDGVHLMHILDPKVDGIYGICEPTTGAPGRNGGAYKIEKV